MTVCGLLRLDGADVRRSALTGMLAASAIGLPAARRVHLDGPFGVVAAADTTAGPIPPVVVSSSGLAVVIVGRSRLRRAAPDAAAPGGGSQPAEDTQAAAVALTRAYRATGQRALAQLGDDLLAIVWEPARHRMVVARGGRRAEELVLWSDGPHFAFGMEPAQVLAVRTARLVRLRRLAAGETMPVTVATRLRRPAFVNLPGPRSGEVDVPAT